MKIHGQFINKKGQTVTVSIVTRNDTTTEAVINDGKSGLWFPASEPFVIESGLNDTFDVVIQATATLRLECEDYQSEFYQKECADAIVTADVDGDCVFYGCVEPRQFSQDFSGGQTSNDIELNLVDMLAALQYQNYANIGSAGISYENYVASAGMISLADVFTENSTTQSQRYHSFWDDASKGYASNVASCFDTFAQTYVSEKVFLGDDEDDLFTSLDTLEAILKLYNLHVVQRGYDYFVFSWETFSKNSENAAVFSNSSHLYPDGHSVPDTPMSISLTPITLSEGNVSGTQMDIDMAETYNRLILEVNPDDASDVVTSPLDSDTMTPMFSSKQKYCTALWTKGTGDTARDAFKALLAGTATDYKEAHTVDYYIWAKKANGWKLGTGKNDGLGGITDWTASSDKTNQQRIPGMLRKQIGAAILSMGSVDKQSDATDNSLTSTIEMDDCLVVSVNGNGQTAEDEYYPTSDDLLKAAPVAVWDGNATGSYYSPSDDQTTNYIVISGKIILVPLLLQSMNYLDKGQSPDVINKLQYPVTAGKDMDGRRLTVRWWKAETPRSTPQDEDGTADYGVPKGVVWRDDVKQNWESYYPFEDVAPQFYPFNFSQVGDGSDKVSKVGALECMLRVGDMVAVEDKDFDESGEKVVTVNGKEVTVRYGNINNITWKKFKTLEQCKSDHQGDLDAAYDEYYQQTITIGFDPKIGDYLIGTEFDIQNNIDYTLGLDTSGMAIPVRSTDHLCGKVHFEILGPVFNQQYDDITRRHRTWFRKEKWTAQTKPLLPAVSSIILKDFSMQIFSDNGMAGADTDTSHRFMSDTDETFVNKKDDLDFTLHSALTTDECEKLGCANAVAPTVPMVKADDGSFSPLLSIFDVNKSKEVKPEQDYIDSYYVEYHVPRIELTFDYDGILSTPFARFTHPALPGKTFYAISVGCDLMEGTTEVKAKEI